MEEVACVHRTNEHTGTRFETQMKKNLSLLNNGKMKALRGAVGDFGLPWVYCVFGIWLSY
jgi:hypothetical protein